MHKKQVADIRVFNRFYTGVIGLLDQHILDSPYTLPEVRILYEIYHSPDLTAKDIIASLGIDKGYLSRLLLQFEKKKLVIRKWSTSDGRAAHLSLTAKGRKEFWLLNESSNRQIRKILSVLTDEERRRLIYHMDEIRTILSKTK